MAVSEATERTAPRRKERVSDLARLSGDMEEWRSGYFVWEESSILGTFGRNIEGDNSLGLFNGLTDIFTQLLYLICVDEPS